MFVGLCIGLEGGCCEKRVLYPAATWNVSAANLTSATWLLRTLLYLHPYSFNLAKFSKIFNVFLRSCSF